MKRLKKVFRKIGGLFFSPLKLPDLRLSSASKISQVALYNQWRTNYKTDLPLPSLDETGFRIFSQFEEDGLLLYVLTILGMGKKLFVDIGAADCINSNCANLALNWGWHGLFIDGDQRNINNGIRYYSENRDTSLYPPKFHCGFITAENINEIILRNGIEGEIQLLNIDIDGNDYWIWKAIDIIQPKIVIIETHVEFGKQPIVVPYDPTHVYPGKHPQYIGASPIAMEKLAKEKGYRMIGCNRFGFNIIFLRNGLAETALPTLTVDDILKHQRNAERYSLVGEIKEWEYVRV